MLPGSCYALLTAFFAPLALRVEGVARFEVTFFVPDAFRAAVAARFLVVFFAVFLAPVTFRAPPAVFLPTAFLALRDLAEAGILAAFFAPDVFREAVGAACVAAFLVAEAFREAAVACFFTAFFAVVAFFDVLRARFFTAFVVFAACFFSAFRAGARRFSTLSTTSEVAAAVVASTLPSASPMTSAARSKRSAISLFLSLHHERLLSVVLASPYPELSRCNPHCGDARRSCGSRTQSPPLSHDGTSHNCCGRNR